MISFPEGKLVCCHHRKYWKWYRSDGHNKVYIPKTNRVLAEQLAMKKYLSLVLKDLEQEKNALGYYLRHHANESSKAEELLTTIPGYRDLLFDFFTPKDQAAVEWMHAPYEKNSKFPEQLLHKTSAGIYVRSKSEAMIVMFLHMHKIPFRYECALNFGNITIHPDFTIRHPETGELFYWEHFGRMDDPVYAKNVPSKLQLYISNGIIPSIHLITTYETQDSPLSSEVIEKTIEHYFL